MIFLAQTDTTAGFLSKNANEINKIKNRQLDKPCVITTSKFKILSELTRVPNKFKNRIRKSKKTTFLYPNLKAIRVIKDGRHSNFLDLHGWMFSSSANLHEKPFDEAWARSVADVVVDENFKNNSPSKILKVSISNIKQLR
ncbi:threonylcarbamoyl-AMP synthase TsaC [Campylobacter pinnipediorum subsp. caledonicus]|uniref:Threonylcarbamoyl-AMP synthase TsaC n=1 Tax=Campylobacter pinnipediorum subsp. caledonicus TaxID=1874362 RepID=A0A1S6U9N7_9BACT|nr:Sua5 YciO YrdC YwlC family protein [Campylobacter pinnipediorum]AQW86731.1 threonylcarbamoyl-AMP synthase TsaC [Campylobacter pinnipediorum subsp. caledonicus]AQW88382.1 threonylcarbamoyl-AMP synthase TsaC [Campylobacter pinnipediorum subsp. caledonicus]OPA72649.1 Sua5 YciO YrdC YwlC family protein [Campylobacter pinnipediorum subsp. caledonicus]